VFLKNKKEGKILKLSSDHQIKTLQKEKSPFPMVWKKASHWQML